jgi:hypothetical protein
MENDSSLYDPAFKEKIETFFAKKEHQNILDAMYAFGVNLRSYHQRPAGIRFEALYNPINDLLKDQWDFDLYSKTELGMDDQGNWDETLTGDAFHVYVIKRAVQFNRPPWAIFFLIGGNQGYLNAGEIDEFIFVDCFSLLPIEFLNKHRSGLERLFSFFDEKQYLLLINGNGAKFEKNKSCHKMDNIEGSGIS